MKKQFDKVLKNLDQNIGMLLLVFMVVVLFIQVIKRYLLNDPLYWVEEISIVASILVVFLGAGVAARKDMHIAIEIIPYPNEIMRHLVILFNNTLIIGFFGFVFYGAFTLLIDLKGVTTPALQIPLSYVMISFPLCAVVICYSYLKKSIASIKMILSGGKKGPA